jgi:hypothetical protein
MRLLLIGLVSVVLVLGLALMALTIGRAATPAERQQIDALARSENECIQCHRDETPGIIEQYGTSTMAVADVVCQDCHEVKAGYPGSVEHEDTHVLGSPSTAMCNECHEEQVAQFNASRHGLPAYVAMTGIEPLTDDQRTLYESIPEGGYQPDKLRNALYQIEGPAVTRFACHGCHDIGQPHPDGSVGQCQECHLRHFFSLEQARKPETCNACHIGPDHPQWEIYHESPHGIAYATGGENWGWEAEPGTLDVTDFPAATCATCHMSGFGTSPTSHDVGDRLTWYLFAPVSERRPNWERNRDLMQAVCLACHNAQFVENLYADADAAVAAVNTWVEESNNVIAPLQANDLLTAEPFDEPIDFVHFDLWHHWGRTAKFGTWMQGPDYVQWHGAYEILHDMAELRTLVDEKLDAAGLGGE